MPDMSVDVIKSRGIWFVSIEHGSLLSYPLIALIISTESSTVRVKGPG